MLPRKLFNFFFKQLHGAEKKYSVAAYRGEKNEAEHNSCNGLNL
jgi:hypothetical protein